jgi:DNA-3-methyladenine glycosylase
MQDSLSTITSAPFPRTFYERNTVRVAKELLGKVLVRRLNSTLLEGIIVETEAYRGRDDAASHAYRGPTKWNQVMFGEPGHAYVYFTYGMHYCLNVTTEPAGQPGAVLIRAAQPIKGIAETKRRRRTDNVKDLSNGPAKLTQAFAITSTLNGHDLTLGRKLYVTELFRPDPFTIVSGTRIGIRVAVERRWRFFVKDNPFVSKQ